MKSGYSIKQKSGTFLYDWPRFLWCLRPGGNPRKASWLAMRNRNDVLVPGPDGVGRKCDWEYTRPLHLCNVFPATGSCLLRRVLRDWPICLRDAPDVTANSTDPQVSFIIGHRGLSRLPHLLLVLKSIAGQTAVSFECIVVEQDDAQLVAAQLPSWIRYIHTPLPYPKMPYCRSWAFNVGARAARGKLLILHDNDMLIPSGYAAEHCRLSESGWEAMNLKRFIFYSERNSAACILRNSTRAEQEARTEMVIENLEGGGSVAVTRDAYFSIGGFDEDFVGWGGEDNEFWDRCGTLKLWPYGYLPLIHLWHEAQPGKRAADGNGLLTAELTAKRRAMDPKQRIQELTKRPWGSLEYSQSKSEPRTA